MDRKREMSQEGISDRAKKLGASKSKSERKKTTEDGKLPPVSGKLKVSRSEERSVFEECQVLKDKMKAYKETMEEGMENIQILKDRKCCQGRVLPKLMRQCLSPEDQHRYLHELPLEISTANKLPELEHSDSQDEL
jgi:hypothetical protein